MTIERDLTSETSPYRRLLERFSRDPLSDEVLELLLATRRSAWALIGSAERAPLSSNVPHKSYFAFQEGNRISRPVNANLFMDDDSSTDELVVSLKLSRPIDIDAAALNRALYTLAISFCCAIDLTRTGDQKTPGTFFEAMVGHLFARTFGVIPHSQLEVLNLDMKAKLPTDFIFDLGQNQPKFHVPVKLSTRERVVQVWAHQRVLDGVYGMGRFLGLLVIMGETKLARDARRVDEICLPDQWRVYQMFIAQLKRIYYLDPRFRYTQLASAFPRIPIKPFGAFFAEALSLALE